MRVLGTMIGVLKHAGVWACAGVCAVAVLSCFVEMRCTPNCWSPSYIVGGGAVERVDLPDCMDYDTYRMPGPVRAVEFAARPQNTARNFIEFFFPAQKWATWRVSLWSVFVAMTVPVATLSCIDRRRVRPGLCSRCGYDLRGAVSGRCSECGSLTGDSQ